MESEVENSVTNLLSFYSMALNALWEKDSWVDFCMYLDLEKAFNKVSHMINVKVGAHRNEGKLSRVARRLS